MANVKSAEKRNRQNIKRRERRSAGRATVKTVAAKTLEAIKADAKGALAAISNAASVLAKAAQKGTIPKGRAARKMSRIHKARNKAMSGAGAKA